MKEKELSVFIGKKIKHLRSERNITQSELGRLIGVKNNTISAYERGVISTDQDILFKLSEILNVSINDFFPQENEVMPVINGYAYFPTAAISAGHPLTIEGVTQAEKISIADKIMGKYAGDKDVFITRISGDSMDKVIPDGSLIAIKPITIDSLKDGDIVVFSNDHDYSVKYYYRHGDKIIFKPHSNNLRHHEQHYDLDDDITIHGKVVTYIVNLD